MAARQRMTMRAAVERNTTVTTDAYNNPEQPVWAAHIASLACWLWSKVEREVMDTRKTAVIEDLRMMVPRGTDITEGDRINGVTDRRGTVVRPGLLSISAVVRRATHLELVLQAVNA